MPTERRKVRVVRSTYQIEFEYYEAYNEFICPKVGGAKMKKLGLVFVMVTSFVFTVSCVNKDMPVTETYYETEYRTETYTDIVNGEDELIPENHWYCENLVISEQSTASENSSLPSLGKSTTSIDFSKIMQSLTFTGTRSFAEVWYLGYKLPQHSSSKVVIQTWEKEIREAETPTLFAPPLSPYNDGKNEMVSAYDVTSIGHIAKPPFDKPLYVVYYDVHYPWEKSAPRLNVYPYEEQQFNEWLNRVNVQLKTSHLDTQFDCSKRENIAGYIGRCLETPKETYEFDTTGVENLAIIIAGREYRGKGEDFTSILREPLLGDPWPIKSIRLIWADEIPKQHQVPYQVEKQRTVMQTQKAPFWEAIFH